MSHSTERIYVVFPFWIKNETAVRWKTGPNSGGGIAGHKGHLVEICGITQKESATVYSHIYFTVKHDSMLTDEASHPLRSSNTRHSHRSGIMFVFSAFAGNKLPFCARHNIKTNCLSSQPREGLLVELQGISILVWTSRIIMNKLGWGCSEQQSNNSKRHTAVLYGQ